MRLSKRERIKLLLRTLEDAKTETANTTGRGGTFSSRALHFHDLYREGSYRELELHLSRLKAANRRVHWHTIRFYGSMPRRPDYTVALRPREGMAELGLLWLERRMGDVFVPQAVSENAGFLASEAAMFARKRVRVAA